MSKHMKVLLIGSRYPNNDPLTQVFKKQIELQIKDICFIDINEVNDYPAKEVNILVIGHLRKTFLSSSLNNPNKFNIMHFIFDKYYFQNLPYRLKANKDNIYKILKNIYANFHPRVIFVNNKVMKSDFENYFHHLKRENIIVHIPNPPSPLMVERRQIIDKISGSIVENPSLLVDTGYSLKQLQMTKLEQPITYAPPSKKLHFERNYAPIALLNYRQFNGRFLSKTPKSNFAKDLLSFSSTEYLTILSHLKNNYQFDNLFNNFGNYFRPDLNTRWKPGTKSTVAAVMGIPLLSIPEISILEARNDFNVVVEFYNSYDELAESFIRLSEMKNRDKLIDMQKMAVEKINHQFKKQFIDRLT